MTGSGSSSGGFRGSGSGGAWESTSGSHSAFVGRVFQDRWEVGPKIGRGGMATVHAGMDLRLRRPVAIKILHAHVADSEEARERLVREARAIAQLRHENVIEVYDYASDDPDATFLITELVEGSSLRVFLQKNERPMPEVAIMIVSELLRALSAAHAVGVIHRDVKPDNVLVGKEGRPKLSDFGIAKVLNEAKMTTTGNLIGSPSYMSPEQADGLETDHRTDLWSVGVLLFRMVTGTLPFRGTSPLETIRRVSQKTFQDPVELCPELSQAMASLIRKALAPELADRYETAEHMLLDTQLILQDAGLADTSTQLPRYFADPKAYRHELSIQLAGEYDRRGRMLMNSGEESRAIDCLNRSSALGGGGEHTQELVRQLSRKRMQGRLRRASLAVALAAIGGLVVAAAVIGADLRKGSGETKAMAAQPIEAEPVAPDVEDEAEVVAADAALPKAASDHAVAPTDASKTDEPTAQPPKPRSTQKRAERKRRSSAKTKPAKLRPAPPPTQPLATGRLKIGTSMWVDLYLDGRRLGRAPDSNDFAITAGAHQLRAEQPGSGCERFERRVNIKANETTRLRIRLDCPR